MDDFGEWLRDFRANLQWKYDGLVHSQRSLTCEESSICDLDDEDGEMRDVWVRDRRVFYYLPDARWRVVRGRGTLAAYCPACALKHHDDPAS